MPAAPRVPRFLHPLTTALLAARPSDPDVSALRGRCDTALARAMAERHLQGTVAELALVNGWRYHHETDSRRSWGGLPDVLLARSGRVLLLELKQASGRLTREQDAWLADVSAAGRVEAAVVGPGDVAAVQLVLRRTAPVLLPPYVPLLGLPLVSMPEVLTAGRQTARARQATAAARRTRPH